MKLLTRIALFSSLFLLPILAAHGADGCVDSPECPTAILGIVGAVGAMLFARLRSR